MKGILDKGPGCEVEATADQNTGKTTANHTHFIWAANMRI